MQNCYNFKNLISQYLDGEISYKDKEFFEEHLHECPECQELFNGIKVTKNQLKNLPVPELSQDFMTNLRDKIIQLRKDQSEDSSTFSNFFNRIPILSYGFATALIVLITAFSIQQYNKMTPATNTAPPSIVKERINQMNKPNQKAQLISSEADSQQQDSTGANNSDSINQKNLEMLQNKITPVKGQ